MLVCVVRSERVVSEVARVRARSAVIVTRYS